MAGLFSTDISEISALVRSVAGGEQKLKKNLGTAGRQAGFIVEGQAKVEAPVKIGNLRAGIGPPVVKQTGTSTVVEVKSHAEYSVPVHEGRGEVVPINAKVLRWDGPNGVVFAMRSRATKPNPYMYRALDKSEANLSDVFERALAQTMREVGLA